MNKNLKFVIILVCIIVALLGVYLFCFREMEVQKNSYFKKVYEGDYTNVEVYVKNVLGQKVKKIDDEKVVKEMLDEIKTLKIKKVSRLEYEKLLMGTSYRFVIVVGDTEFSLVISSDSVTIGEKIYWVDENIIEKLEEILKDYQDVL